MIYLYKVMKYVKKFGPFLSIASLLISIGISMIPAHVYAAVEDASTYGLKVSNNAVTIKPSDITLTWIDASNLEMKFTNGKTLTFTPDSGLKAERLGSDSVKFTSKAFDCDGVAEINFNYPSSADTNDKKMLVKFRSGEVMMKFSPGPGLDCKATSPQKIDVSINSPDNSIAYFRWINAGHIQASDGKDPGTFTRAPGSKIFLRDENTECQDKLLLTGANTVEWYELNKYQTANSDNVFIGDPPPSIGAAAGCKYNKNSFITNAVTWNLANIAGSSAPVDGGSVIGPDGVGGGGGGTQETTCESKDDSTLGWIACAIIRALDKTLKTINKEVENIMQIDVAKFEGADNNIKSAWSNIKNISTLLLVIITLIMVISSVLEVGPFDAYTIKKLLPRLLGAVIFMQLSWFIMIFMITITNELGKGITDIILSPFGGAKITGLSSELAQSGAGSQLLSFNIVAIGGAGIAAASLGVLGLLSLAFTTLLSVLIGFIVLLLRNIVIIAAVIFAPFAIVCYILPSTKKIADFWWDAFSKGLLMYPLIMMLFASGKIFAYITANKDSSGWDLFQFFAVIVSYVAPYFLIPATFRLAGGAVATLGGMVNNRGKGIFDRSKKYRQSKIQSNVHDMKARNRFKGNSRLGNLANRGFQIGANAPSAGLDPRRMKTRLNAALSTQVFEDAKEQTEKNGAFKSIAGNDDFLEAGRVVKGVKNSDGSARDGSEKGIAGYLRDKGYKGEDLTQAVASIRTARRSMSDHAYAVASTLSLPSTGTGFGNGAGDMDRAIFDATSNDTMLASRMLAEMRGSATQARRGDLAGGGYGHRLGVYKKLQDVMMRPDATETEIAMVQADSSRTIDRETLRTQSGGTIASLKAGQLGRLSQMMAFDASSAVAATAGVAGTAGEDDVVRLALRQFGAIAGRHDVANQISPEQAGVIADNTLSQKIEVSTMSPKLRQKLTSAIFPPDAYDIQDYQVPDPASPTGMRTEQRRVPNPARARTMLTIQQINEALAGDDVYKEARKEYATSANAAAAASTAAGVTGAPTAPPSIP